MMAPPPPLFPRPSPSCFKDGVFRISIFFLSFPFFFLYFLISFFWLEEEFRMGSPPLFSPSPSPPLISSLLLLSSSCLRIRWREKRRRSPFLLPSPLQLFFSRYDLKEKGIICFFPPISFFFLSYSSFTPSLSIEFEEESSRRLLSPPLLPLSFSFLLRFSPF